MDKNANRCEPSSGDILQHFGITRQPHLGLSSRPIQKSYQGQPELPWLHNSAPALKELAYK